jgi:hypothetical protein
MSPISPWPVRAALVLAGLVLALVTLAEYRSLQASRAEAFRWLERSRVTLDAAALDREPDPERVRLRAARAVLVAELDPARQQGAAPESAGRMTEVARAGREILARRPASWEAALTAGAGTYLAWSQTRDARLFTAYREWHDPLVAAYHLGPDQGDPVRFLTAAYLETWPALSPHRRQLARGLLAEVFRNPEDLARLLGPWLDTAADRREAFAVLPDDPEVWERVAKAYSQRGDLDGFAAAQGRGEAALLAALHRKLLTADQLRGDGRLEEARVLYLAVAERARPEARYRGLLAGALERCPPGPVDRRTAERLAPHLARALDRCLFAGCELSSAALKRLARFARDPDPSQAALAALFAGDLPRAELYERRTEALGTDRWAPYWIAKARVLAARGRADEAREALTQVSLDWQRRPLYWQVRADVARAAGDAGSAAEAGAHLAAAARRTWPTTDWTWHRGVARLEAVTSAPASGLTVRLDSVPEHGSLVELRVDGAAVGAFPVRPGAALAPALRPGFPLGAGLHVFELESLDGGRVLPGDVELR